jgi:hypothetical protein
MLKPLLNCLLAVDALWRLGHREEHRRVISETGDELFDIEVLKCPQELSSDRFNRCAVGGLVCRLNGDREWPTRPEKAIAVTMEVLLIIYAGDDS